MKKLLLAALLCYSLTASSQTYIKTNALYWVGLLPNVQVETNLGAGFTFQGEINASLWTIKDNPMMGIQNIIGARWYPKAAFNGFYVGGDFGFDVFKVSNFSYWNRPEGRYIQRGYGYYLGITLGYQISIAKRWNMDFYAGGGWHLAKYWGERINSDGSSEMYADWNASGEWIPYKIGVTFAYRLTSNKRLFKKFHYNHFSISEIKAR